MTDQTAIDTVSKWISSSTTIDQLNCCLMFVQDTLYIRFNLNKEVDALREQIEAAKERMYVLNKQQQAPNEEGKFQSPAENTSPFATLIAEHEMPAGSAFAEE